jgi:hypothetical protein
MKVRMCFGMENPLRNNVFVAPNAVIRTDYERCSLL